MRAADRQELLDEARSSGALDELPPDQKQALELWATGAGYKRLAAMLNISQSGARGRVDRALSRLRRRATAA